MNNDLNTDGKSEVTVIHDSELMQWIYDNDTHLEDLISDVDEKYEGQYELAGIQVVLRKTTDVMMSEVTL